MRITIERVLTGDVAKTLLATHQEVFAHLATLAAERQSLPAPTFLALLERPDVLEFVGWADDGEPVSLMIVTTNLSLVDWIEPAFFQALYPDYARREAIYYVLTLQIASGHQDGPLIEAMIESFSLYIWLKKGVLVFDSCQWDIDNLAVPQFVERLARRHLEGNCSEIDAQRFYGYEATALKALDLRDRRDHGVEIDLTEPPSTTVDSRRLAREERP
jgi:hypothetical protein